MSEFRRQVILTIVTAVVAAAILTPVLFAVKLLLEAGLEFVFAGSVSFGLVLAYVLRRETMQ